MIIIIICGKGNPHSEVECTAWTWSRH